MQKNMRKKLQGDVQEERKIKSLQELDLADDFMFFKVMADEEICKAVLEEILGIRIKRIKAVMSEKVLKMDLEAKGIRLDVYVADDEESRYSIEMQNKNEYNIPKRARYYQGTMDLDMIDRGVSYSSLRKNIVIFICTFDSFNRGRHKYTFVNTCIEDRELLLNDETEKIVLNTKGTMDDVNETMLEFLKYVENSTDKVAAGSKSPLVKKLHRAVKKVKANKDLEVEYLKLLERDEKNRREGIEEGIKQGLEQGKRAFVLDNIEENVPEERIIEKLQKHFELSEDESRKLILQIKKLKAAGVDVNTI